ncbi:MAG: hypothetical protein RI554_06840 [Trueperaceae bacterium]|nr:hypothetical protein [Trueperaceae bacterium]
MHAPVPTPRHRAAPIARAAMTLALLLAAAFAAAQAPLPADAQAPYDAARDAMRQAIADDVPPYPDQPAWREATLQARRAVDAAPDDPRTLGLLAEVYARSTFHVRAWEAWQAYLATGADLDATQAPLFVEAGEELAWSAYERGDLETAAGYYDAILDAIPFQRDARVWMGRIRMEQGRPADALPYWEAAAEQDPTDDRAAYFADLAREQARWGVAAETAFRAGVTAYEAGDLAGAATQFARATRANDAYPDAWAWRGRVAFDRGGFAAAEAHYARAADLAPENELYAYFEAESARRAAD